MPSNFYDLLKYAKTGIAAPSMNNLEKIRALSLASGYPLSTITGVTPLTFRADGRPLTAWSIYGNGQQTGTPTPDNPIMPEFVGVRTGNLYNSSETDWELGILDDNGNPTGSTTSHYTKNFTAVEPGTAYYLSGTIYIGQSSHRIYYYDANRNWISRSTLLGYYDSNFTTPANCKYVRFQMIIDLVSTSDWMLNTGSTPLPYEPYGYKIPVTCAGQTIPVYLGQTQTIRQIKKLVLDGSEDWALQSVNGYGIANFQIMVPRKLPGAAETMPSSHFVRQTTLIADTQDVGFLIAGGTSKILYLRCDSSIGTNLPDFKTWLATQKTNGTPVTFWYVLETPETASANEPLAKIGNYADELHGENAGVTIPTTRGQNVLTVGTDLQPSSVSITGHIKLT